MRKFAILLSVLISLLLSFNALALEVEYNNPNDPNEPTVYASTPAKDSNYAYRYRWTWLHNDLCVQFQASELRTVKVRRDTLQNKHDAGLMTRWCEGNQLKNRETYSGKWSQSEDGVWSFQFDDYTIPVDITKIDGVLYAFNGYGELVEGYDYWNGHKTAADGLVTCTDPEFITYLETQYIPDCTSHE
jgi:hypothetical protein